MPSFSTPRGTQDILPEQRAAFDFVLREADAIANLYAYRRIETPSFAETNLFERTSGEGSDIVEHEMYTFQDRGGDSLTLRPEGTAPVMRAYLQHGMNRLPQPVKLYYVERMYRYERPQKGRYREHRQLGCEAIGSDDALVDVEMISLVVDLLGALRLRDMNLHLNSIGDERCRPAYVNLLTAYLREHQAGLAPLDQERLERSPLRVLDSKEPVSRAVLDGAPSSIDHLCEECRLHWQQLLAGLATVGISYTPAPRLVRGLNYYTRTVFEFIPDAGGSQSTVVAGGRYDALSQAMGGAPIPGIGFGAGVERLVQEVQQQGVDVEATARPQVFVVHMGDHTGEAALRVAVELRKAGVPTDVAFGERSLKSQMKQAGSSMARYAVIVGADEMAAEQVTLRQLETGTQETLPFQQALETLRQMTQREGT